MIQAAVTRLAPLSLLALFSCTGTRQQVERDPNRPQPVEDDVMAARSPRSGLKVSAAADETPVKPGTGRVTRIMLGDLFQLQQENRVLIFDVRPAFVYQLGHIQGAVNWPKASFNDQLSSNEARIAAAKTGKKPVVLYCVDFACPDARTVAIHLAGFGYSSSTLTGGWDAWRESGLGDL